MRTIINNINYNQLSDLKEDSMSIRVGKPAPEFTAQAYVPGRPDPQQVRLSDYRGKWVVLFFYPRDFTFVCPTEIEAFADLHDEFEREDAVVLGASTDSYAVHKAWFESDPRLAKVSYPVLADTTQRLAALYDVLDDDGAALRGTFIIDPDRVLQHATLNNRDVGRSIEEHLRTLQACKTGMLCPAGWTAGQPTL
jgi:peroxiredoxin (alkyl hydroperoxide reductase subunit C)